MSSRYKSYAINVDTSLKQLMEEKNLAFSHRPTAIITILHDTQLTEFDMKHYIERGLRIAGFRSTISQEHKKNLIDKLKKATEWCCQKYDVTTWPIALTIEIPNAGISTGFLDNNKPVLLKKDSIVAITSDIKYSSKCDQDTIFINDQYTLPTVTAGTEITLGFGKIVMYCTEVIDEKILKCKVIKEGTLDSQEIVCFRGIKLLKPSLSKTDMDIIQFAKDHEFDMITVNTIRYPSTVNRVRDLFKNARHKPLIISTICEQEGLNNIDDIIEVSDGLILAREFLAATIKNKHYLLRIQMQVSATCKLLGKPFFISGNILESSVDKGIIAASDLNDVINAVAQGAGLVLRVYKNARDTSTALQLLDNIFSIVDTSFAHQEQLWREPNYRNMTPVNAAVACVQSCVLAAKAMATTVIIVLSVSGQTVRQLSHWSDNFTIIAITSSQRVARQLLLHSGVISVVYDKKRLPEWEEESISRIKFAASYGIRFKLLKYGETFVVLRKHFPASVYCDRVAIWKVVTIEESNRNELMSTQDTCRTVGVKTGTIFKFIRQTDDDLAN